MNCRYRQTGPCRCVGTWAGFVFLVCLPFALPAAETEAAISLEGGGADFTEAELKAAVVCQITRFVEWPTPPPTNAALVIGVVGESPWFSALEQLVASAQNLQSPPLTLRKLPPNFSRSNAAPCHVVVIGEGVPERAVITMLEALGGQDILTVSAMPDFCRKGGMVGLKLMDRRVQLEVNLEACERARIRLSARLLRQAKIINGPAPSGR